jgi:prolyl 4-hydroxylase
MAVLAFALGLGTPALLDFFPGSTKPTTPTTMYMKQQQQQRQRRHDPPTASSSTTKTRTVEEEQPLRYPCTPQLLEQLWHDEPVPGLHIVCFEKQQPPTKQPIIQLTLYRGAVRLTEHNLSLSTPLSWSEPQGGLKTILTEKLLLRSADAMHQPWAFFTPAGERVIDESSIEDPVGWFADTIATKVGTLLLFQGGQFIWPGVRVGFQRTVELYTVMPEQPPNLQLDPSKNRTAILETLSLSPLVISVRGFLSGDECEHIQKVAAPSMQYSGVVLMDHDAGRPASDFRTSQTTFLSANKDTILTDIDYRTASLVRIPRRHQEPVQVLRYGHDERYTSHHDYFDPNLYRKDPSTLRLIGHGRRNRMVTVFWYLTTVEEGGETVFPRAFGGKERSVEDCETGLRVQPEEGKVIIFYSMTPDGKVDPKSLHGACRVKKGIKWAANKVGRFPQLPVFYLFAMLPTFLVSFNS